MHVYSILYLCYLPLIVYDSPGLVQPLYQLGDGGDKSLKGEYSQQYNGTHNSEYF